MAEGYSNHSERRLSEALDDAAAKVDWPAFGDRLRHGLASRRPGRAGWDVVCAAGHLLAAAVLLAVAVAFGAALLGQAPRQAIPHTGRSAPIVAEAGSAATGAPGDRDEPLSVDALLARLPAAVPDMDWLGTPMQ